MISDDEKSIRLQAHSIKGMCGNVAALKMRETAYKIETAANSGDMDTARGLIPALEKEFETFLSVLAIKR